MTPFLVTIIPALVLFALGGFMLAKGPAAGEIILRQLRSTVFAGVTFGFAAIWFLYLVSQLGEADFGNYKKLLLIAFGAVAVGSWFYLPDFLGVRGAAILVLLFSQVLLRTIFGLYAPGYLFVVSFVYVMIIAALYIGALPYRARDFTEWLYKKPVRAKALAGFSVFYGVVLTVAALMY